MQWSSQSMRNVVKIVDVMFIVVWVIELSLKLFARGKAFIKDILLVSDYALMITSLVLALAYVWH